SAHTSLQGLQTKDLSQQAQQTLAGISAATVKLNGLVDKLSAVDGIYSGVQRATDSVVDAARDTSAAGEELAQTLRAVRLAAGSIQRLADALETDSDMLLKGRTKR